MSVFAFGRTSNKRQTGKDLIFVPSGGQGQDEVIPEALAMKNYLLEQGIKEEQILVEDGSQNTYENILFSGNVIKKKTQKSIQDVQIAYSTTNYHVYRAGVIANRQGVSMEGIGAKTKTYFWINAFIREYIATLFTEMRKHIAVICSLLTAAVTMIGIEYLSNRL